MPIGFLVTVTFIASCTAFALWPLHRPVLLARLSWGSGMVVNELPFLAGSWLALATGLAYLEGDVDASGAWIAVGIAAATMVGLVVLVLRATKTGPALEHALAAGLGRDWRSDLDPRAAGRLRRHVPRLRILLGPIAVGQVGVERLRSISYAPGGDEHTLDLYRHRSHPRGPVLIHLHGGAFAHGRKSRESRPLFYRLAGEGWICVSANYRLAPVARFPDAVVDAKRVIAWIRTTGLEYGADPSRVFIAGSSAGAHLAMMAALTPNRSGFQPGFEDDDTSVSGAIGLCGYYDRASDDPASAPAAWAGPQAPPVFIAHGASDTYVPIATARDFAERLARASSRPVVFADLPGGQHGFDLFHSIRFEHVVDAIEAFAAWVLSARGPAPGATAAAPARSAGIDGWGRTRRRGSTSRRRA